MTIARKFNSQRFGRAVKVVILGWIVLWIGGIGVFGLTGYFVKNCQLVQKEYNEQLLNFKKEAELQDKKRAELNIEFEKEYRETHPYTYREEERSADEYLLKESAREEYLKQNGISLELFPTLSTPLEYIVKGVFEKKYSGLSAKNSFCEDVLLIRGVGFLLGTPVLILYLLFLYLFPRQKKKT